MNKRVFGRSIELRASIVAQHIKFGNWETDTVRGHKNGVALLTQIEKKSSHAIIGKLPNGKSESVLLAMLDIYNECGSEFSRIFQSITADNGNEFADLTGFEEVGTKVFYAHPYLSSERI